MCTLSSSPSPVPITLYGPLGLREFVETTLRLSHSGLSFKYEIVELIPNSFDGVDEDLIKKTVDQEQINERFRQISIDEDGKYTVVSDEDNCSVYAVSIKHRVPCYG